MCKYLISHWVACFVKYMENTVRIKYCQDNELKGFSFITKGNVNGE